MSSDMYFTDAETDFREEIRAVLAADVAPFAKQIDGDDVVPEEVFRTLAP